MKTFLKELTRRKVWLFGGIYLALGWIVLQVAIAIEGALELPSWVDQVTIVFLALGFPFALLMAWAQESQGRENTADQADKVGEIEDAPSRLAIAVLPFADMSPEGDQDWFSDGISEEILHRLAAEKALSVAGRTSSFHFKGKTASFEEIGKMLGVGSVLEGSVRKMENRVRITAQLIEVATGFHIWSGTFDRELEDIFRIQEDISEAIATALLREIGAAASEPDYVPYEPNIEAYQAFLRGREVWQRFTPESTAQGVEWFKKAMELDQDYLGPVMLLISLVTYNQGPGGILPLDHYQDMGALVAEARRRDPLEQAELAIKAFFAQFQRRFVDADAFYKELANRDLMFGVVNNSASFLVETGRYKEALESGTLLLADDPLNPAWTFWQGEHLLANGLFKEILDLVKTSRSLGVHVPNLMLARAFAEGFLGDWDGMRRHVYRIVYYYGAETGGGLAMRIVPAWFDDNLEEIKEIRTKLISLFEKGDIDASPVEIANCSVMLGEPDEAIDWLRKANDMNHHDISKAISRPPQWPIRKFLTHDPRGRAFLEEAEFDLAWFPMPEQGVE